LPRTAGAKPHNRRVRIVPWIPPVFRDRAAAGRAGLTLAAACRWARAQKVARLIAATPVGHVDGLARVREEADLLVCPHPLEEIAVVGQAYDVFDPLDEWYVAGLLADAAARGDE
jgi:predicted phosphoribosyltransferase